MSLISVRNVLEGISRDQALEMTIGFLADLGFQTDSWQPGSVQRTLVTALAWTIADSTDVIRDLAGNAFDSTASGAFLDAVSAFYGNTRVPASPTVGLVTLTSATGSSPQSWNAGEVLISASADGSAPLFRISESGSIAATETKTFQVTAAANGTAGNVPNGPAYLVTALSGVTAAFVADATTGTWITSPGTDLESDQRLRERNALKWSQLSYGARRDAYSLWAREADASITRTSVDPDGSGGVTITVATAVGAASAGQVVEIQEYIDARHPFSDTPTVQAASVNNIAVTLAPTIQAGTTTVADIQVTVNEYLGSLPLGGIVVPPSSVGQVLRDELIERIMALPGVRRANLTSPAGDVSLAVDEIASATFTITPTLVLE